jgi:RNA polymerase sigma-70 factor, ECF subfamily
VFVERLDPSTQRLEDIDTARLVARIQGGDADGFGELYLRYFDRVYSYMRVALRDNHEAEDATQDVFMQALRALPRYELRGQPPRRWLFRIARNQAIDRARRRRSVPEDPAVLEARLEDTGEAGSAGPFSDSRLAEEVARLPETQREVLFLRYAAGLDAPEIAALVDRSAAAVRQIQHRALVELRRRLPAARELAAA